MKKDGAPFRVGNADPGQNPVEGKAPMLKVLEKSP